MSHAVSGVTVCQVLLSSNISLLLQYVLQEGAVRLLRTQSAPADDVEAEAGGSRSLKKLASKQFAAISEPSSPMIAAGELPESLRNVSVAAHRTSSEARCPSFQTGFKPW